MYQTTNNTTQYDNDQGSKTLSRKEKRDLKKKSKKLNKKHKQDEDNNNSNSNSNSNNSNNNNNHNNVNNINNNNNNNNNEEKKNLTASHPQTAPLSGATTSDTLHNTRHTLNNNKKKRNLFEEEEETEVHFNINREFAKQYLEKKKHDEFIKLKNKYGDNPLPSESSSSSSTDEDEDEDAVMSSYIANDFMEVLPRISARDQSIKDPKVAFFKEQENEEDTTTSSDSEEKDSKKDKPYRYADQVRDDILEKMNKGTAEDSEDEQEKQNFTKSRNSRTTGLSIAEEERKAKEDFLKAVKMQEEEEKAAAASAAAQDSLNSENGLLKKRKKTTEDIEKEENEYKTFLTEKKKRKGNDTEILTNYWENNTLNEDEKFLRNYILNKGWIDKDKDKIPTYEELFTEADAEDDEALDNQDQFEATYNFRFEEPNATIIPTYGRKIPDSVRQPDERRKLKRQKRKEKKSKEMKQKEDEKKHLMKLKKEQIFQRLSKIKEISGTTDEKLSSINLDEDFDPETFDKQMSSVFDENYYEQQEEEPNFINNQEQEIEGGTASQTTFDKFMEADFESELAKDPKFEKYLDEYYQLDYEDMIGDIPCRFKYVNVTPYNYNLNAKEILESDDKVLRRIVSTKKLQPYREDQGLPVKKKKKKKSKSTNR